MIPSLIVALMLGLGIGTATIADSARPGDTLFGIDQLVEHARIAIASTEKKDELRLKFADERIAELKDIKSVSDTTLPETKEKIATGVTAALSLINEVSPSASVQTQNDLSTISSELDQYVADFSDEDIVDIQESIGEHGDRVDIEKQKGTTHVRIISPNDTQSSEENDEKEISSEKDKKKDEVSTSREDDREGDEGEEEGEDDYRGPRVPPVVPTPTTPAATTVYTLAQVRTHSTKASCWTAVNKNVYDVTSWIAQHPGGQSAIIAMCGVDASADFNGQHGGQSRPESELASFKIGVVK